MRFYLLKIIYFSFRNLPLLPKRKLFGWFDKDFLEKRRHDLQEYLVRCVYHFINVQASFLLMSFS